MRYDTSTINALILAGGVNKIKLYDGYTPGYKALLPFRGKPLIQYTLDALRETHRIRRACIVGPVEEVRKAIAHSEEYEFESGGETLIENIYRGLNHFRACPAVLVIPSDLPLTKAAAIRDFLDKIGHLETEYETAIFWSLVRAEDFEGPYMNVKKGFNRFRDVSICHGNLLLMTPSLLKNRSFTSRMNSIYNARKSSVRAALAIGPLAGLVYLIGVHMLHALTLDQFAWIASAAFNIHLVPVAVHDPGIATDIDEPRDYQFIMEELDRRAKS